MNRERWGFGAAVAGVFFFSVSFAFAQESAKMVAEGDKLYRKREYAQALERYEEALKAQPESPDLAFNVAAGQYKTEDFSAASRSFEKALSTADKRQEAWANYNLGNSRYEAGAGLRETQPQKAVSLWEGALADYKRAMALDPKDRDIKLNYEIVARDLKLLKEKLQSQPPPPSSSQQKEDKQSSQQPKKEEGAPDKGQQPQESPSEGQKQPQPQGQPQQKEDQGKEGEEDRSGAPQAPSDERDQGEGAASEGEPREMSPREAQMLLDDFRRQEMPLGMIDDKRQAREKDVSKDW
jgi:tetratricopeptide (TPR) repeat protein